MDGAQACYLYLAAAGRDEASASRRAWGSMRSEALGASPRGTAPSADLGGSSNYSNENFED